MGTKRAKRAPSRQRRVARDALTFHALQRLEQGELQQLGDAYLPLEYDELRELKSNGLSAEGKTRTGVPDSFVGPSPDACAAAVEYTSKESGLVGKLTSDYEGVRTRCPSAVRIVLFTNRVIMTRDARSLRARARTDRVTLTLVDGVDLADSLAMDHQDLRERFLGIRVGAHNRETLVGAMRNRLLKALPPKLVDALERRALRQHVADGRLHALVADPKAPVILATGPSGAGKSTWSARHALARAETQPTVWMPASALRLSSGDPIGLALAQAAYGASDPSRLPELAVVHRREHLTAFVVLDGVDEVADFSALILALTEFQRSAMGPHTRLLLSCREEALPSLDDFIRSFQPALLDGKEGTRITLEPIADSAIEDFLRSEGATPEEVRTVVGSLPPHLRGLPLFLRQALTLAKAGEAVDGERVIDSFATYAVRDMHRRLRDGGRGPSLQHISEALRELALEAISAPTDTVAGRRVGEIFGAQGLLEGEDTILGRAVHAGLVDVRASGAVAFHHPLYLEFFAASALEGAWCPRLPELRTDRGKQIARRIAPFLASPGWLVQELLALDPIVACRCAAAARTVPENVSQALVAAIASTLGSRFRFDRNRALALLARMPGPSARDAAAAWWNALDAQARASHLLEAADAFLWLEMLDAFDIILHHRSFWPARPWYEPNFVARLRRLSTPFRVAVVTKALAELEADGVVEERRQRLVTVLAMFDDKSFVKHIRERAERVDPLSGAEMRALIHANTQEAMEAYAVNVDNVLAIPLEREPGETDEQKRDSRYQRRDALVPLGVDVAMHPHEAFSDLAVDAMSGQGPRLITFGLSAAARAGDEGLLPSYVAAKRRRGRRYIDMGNRIVERLLEGCSAAEILRMFDAYPDPDIRQQIVHHAHNVPGPATEAFLLERLAAGEHVFSAIQSLGLLRAFRAGPAILKVYLSRAPGRGIRYICVQALGQMRYGPAGPILAKALRRSVVDRSDGESEYALAEALGWIDGEEAASALAAIFPKARHPERILSALFRLRVAGARQLATDIVTANGVSASVLARALDPFRADDLDPGTLGSDLDDDRLLNVLLTGADAILTGQDSLAAMHLAPALARFKAPQATAILERIAWGGGAHAADAMTALARRGHGRAVRAVIEIELAQVEDDRRPLSPWTAGRLNEWPVVTVRDALIARVEKGDSVGRWLFLLRWFASAEDVALYQRFEKEGDVAAADVAHQFLNGTRPPFPRR